MRVLVLQRIHYHGRVREPGEIVELDPNDHTNEAGVLEPPRWGVLDRDHFPAASPRPATNLFGKNALPAAAKKDRDERSR